MSRLNEGENKLRAHLPRDTPLKLVLYFNAIPGEWLVRTSIHMEGHPRMDFDPEPLLSFPSDELIATAMLIA